MYKEVTKMASLRFFFDGERRPEKVRPPMPYFPGRYMVPRRYPNYPNYHNYPNENYRKEENRDVAEKLPENENKQGINNDLNEQKKQTEPKAHEVSQQDNFQIEQGIKDTPNDDKKAKYDNSKTPEQEIPHEGTASEEAKGSKEEDISVNVSEKLIGQLSNMENKLVNAKGQVDNAKNMFDEVIFKLDSFMQIMDIIKANEERRINKPQASVQGVKTNKDTVDEFLELLQAPVFQNVLRQFLIGVLVKK